MRRPIQTLALALGALCASAYAVEAAAPGGLTVAVHESRRIALKGAAATVVVGDPDVADVAMADMHTLILIGKGYGVTQLLVTDKAGHTLLQSQVSVVSSDVGRVTVYRGAAYSEFTCGGGRCHQIGPTVSTGGGDTSGGGAPAAQVAPQTPSATQTLNPSL
jgi:hypothetical protein